MSDLTLVRAALAHGSTSPLPVPNFACALLRLEGVQGSLPASGATVTDLPARPGADLRRALEPELQAAG